MHEGIGGEIWGEGIGGVGGAPSEAWGEGVESVSSGQNSTALASLDIEGAIGALFLRFLRFFGRDFDPKRHYLSISRNPPGLFLLAPGQLPMGPDGVSTSTSPFIEDPLSPTKNVARTAFRYDPDIRGLFLSKLIELESKGLGLLNSGQGASLNLLRGVVLPY